MSHFQNNRLFTLLVFFLISSSAFGNQDWQHQTKSLVNSLSSMNNPSPQTPCTSSEVASEPTEHEKWAFAGFENPSIDLLEAKLSSSYSKNKFTHEIRLTMVLFRNSGWSKKYLEKRLNRVAEIYSQCGIKVASAKLVTIDAPNGWIDIDYKKEQRDLKIASITPPTDKPILYYVRSSKEGSNAYAWNQSQKKPSHLTDTVWMTSSINTPEYITSRDPKYSPDAHELGHVFGNCGHTEDGSANFLAGQFELLNDKIQPEQCESMKKHSLVRPL